MAKLLKLRRGTTTQHSSFTGAEGEVTVDTDKETLVVHDGSTAGGHPVAAEDLANVSSSTIAGRLSNDSIAVSKIAAGTLPSDVKVEHGNIIDGTVRNAEINASAAIAGTKISPDFGSQDIVTTGKIKVDGDGGGKYISVGDNEDLKIYHDATGPSIIADSGNQGLKISAKNLNFTEYTGSTTRFRINDDGHVDVTGNLDVGAGIDVTGEIVGDRASFKDDGTAGPTVSIMTDDNSPWALSIGNDTYSTQAHKGLMFYQNNDGTMYHHFRGIGSFEPIYFQTSNNTTTNNFMYVDTSRAVHLEYQDGTKLSTTSTGISVTGNVAVSGTVDGRDVASDGSKLDGIESGATADQSGSEIATAIRGQQLGASSDGVHDVYNDGWFRNNQSGEGLYNQATTQHFYSDHDDYWNIAGGSGANGLRFRDESGGTTRGYVYCNNSSQIGFLNSGGSWSLQCDNSGNVTATGNVTAYSDARLKTNVNTINDALGIVGKLRGVSFDWKETGKRSIGVIAQEVEAVLPELVVTQEVSTGENPEPKEVKSVDYGKIVGVLINAINELKAELDEHKKGGK